MSPAAVPARPSQVTVAGWSVAIASVVVVLAAFQAMGNLNSVDMRDELTETLSSGAAKDLGLSVADALVVIRWCLYVTGVAAVVTGILGVYVLQRHHVARIVLSVAAVPVVLTTPFVGSLPGLVVGVGAAMLWSRPARDWFAGRPITPARPGSLFAPREKAAPRQDRETKPSAPVSPPPEVRMPPATGAPLPPPTPSWGTPPAGPGAVDFPAPTSTPVIPAAWPPPTGDRPGDGAPMPQKVKLACVLTWVFGGISAVGSLVMLVAVAIAHEDLVDQITQDSRWDSSLDSDLIVPALVAFGSLVLVWSVANGVLAYFVWRRRHWAWVALSISIGLAALMSAVGLPWSLVHIAALAASLGALLSRASRAWFAGRS